MTEATVVPARATREAYRDRLVAQLAEQAKLICLDTDTGLFGGVDFGPAADRYVNLGIAEQNLMGVAAGMAAAGWTPYVNTFAAFAAARAIEAVKIDIAYNALPVRIAATHSGLAAGHLGPTHQALEDLAVMRALPNMTVVVPADAAAVEAVMEQATRLPGPLYLRLGRKATPAVPTAEPLVIGQVQMLRPGHEVVLVACGPHPVRAALAAAEELAAEGIEPVVLNMHTVKPLDVAGLCAATADAQLVVTVEEHWRGGGLGSAVTETLAEHRPVPVVRVGMPDTFASYVGGHEPLLEHYGISAPAVAAAVREHLPRFSPPANPRRGGHPVVDPNGSGRVRREVEQ